MRVIFCGGGTAGHITPALAVAEQIKREHPKSSFVFVGRDGGAENKIIVKEGYTLKTVKIQGLKRHLSTENIKSALFTIKAIRRAKEIIREFRPDIVVGTGGYVCLPVLIAAKRLNVKCVMHESNVIPGLTTKLLARKVDLLLLGYESSKKHLTKVKRYKVVGTPLREDFYKLTRESARRKLGLRENDFFILSFGGSLGAEKMNTAIGEFMSKYSASERNIIHIHGSGERYYEKMKKEFHLPSETRCKILPFITNLPTMMKAADIAICRCGAVTLSEICEAEVASILIPSPNVSDNHQQKNAMLFQEKGAAYLLDEDKLSAESLKKAIFFLKNDKNARKSMAKSLKSLSTPNSAKSFSDELKKLIF